MSNHLKLLSSLEKLGLSDNQARVYLLLVEKEELRIGQISDLTEIPRTSVYEILRNLENLGLIERVIGENFVRLRAYPLDSIRQNLERKREDLNNLTSELDELEKDLALNIRNQKGGPAVVRYYRGLAGAQQLLWNTLKTSDMVYVYSSWHRDKYVGSRFYRRFVSQSKERNILEQVLINPNQRTFNSIRKNIGSPLSRTKMADIHVLPQKLVSIKGDTFIYDNIYAQVYLEGEQIHGFEIDSSQFTTTQKSIFKTLLVMSKPLAEVI